MKKILKIVYIITNLKKFGNTVAKKIFMIFINIEIF